MEKASLERGAGPDAPLLRRVSTAYLGFVALFAAAALLLALRDHFDVLFVDDWRILDSYQSQELLPYLFTAENGHRLPLTLALFAIDYEWFGGRMLLLVLATIACMALAAGLLWQIFRWQEGAGNALSRTLFGFACFSLVWAASCNDLLRGLYQMNLQTVALLVFALGVLARLDPTRLRGAWKSLGLAVVAALIATLSQGAGAASWAALVAVALLRRFPWRIVVALAATGAAVIGLFASTLPPHPKISFESSLAFVARNPVAFASYTLSFVGSAPARIVAGLGIGAPVPKTPERGAWTAHTRDLRRISVVLGAAGLVLFLVAAVRRWQRPLPRSSLDSLALGLMAFAIGAACLVAFARAAIVGPAALVQPRFITWSALFWIGAVCALAPRSAGRVRAPVASLAVIAFPILSLCMLPALRDAREFHATTASQASRLVLSLLLELRYDELARNVSLEDADLVYRVASRLESEERWPFRGPRDRLRGTLLARRFAVVEPCAGAVDRARAIDATGAAAVSGWIDRATASEEASFVVLADEGGVVRGIADAASVPPRYASGLGRKRTGWTGFIADYDPTMRYSAYAVLGDGSTACLLRMR